MYLLKIIVSSFLIGSLDQTIPDENGWVSVERPESIQEEFLDIEKGIWVVFSKHFEGEKFQVRFPEDPSYESIENGIRLRAIKGENTLSLGVEKGEGRAVQPFFRERINEIKISPATLLLKAEESEGGKALDLFYRKGENWVWERIFFSSTLIYTFQTESSDMSGSLHRKFVSSLEIL